MKLQLIDNTNSPDHNAERLAKLKEIMPDIFTNEGKLNINELKKVIDPELVNETERYEFRWFGKSKAKREAFTPTDATLVYDEDRSVNPKDSENIIIEGENLAVLKLLSNAYREKVKCIYIDPPYNTGKDFVYSDKWNQDKAEYWEDAEYVENGMKVDTNVETDGRFHSNWLNMMYSRLLIARQVLKEDGVIFISIDDNEISHLRKLCNEVFGEENFIVQIIWKKRNTPPNDQIIGTQHDYILAYAKNKEILKLYPKPRTKEQLSKFKNPDKHPKGDWTSGDLSANIKGGRYSAALDFEIINPNTKKPYKSPTGNWRFNKEKIDSLINSDEIHFGKDGKTAPKLKRFLSDLKEGVTWSSLWDFVQQYLKAQNPSAS
jgi:adenine-specific DNA-methyltransferase